MLAELFTRHRALVQFLEKKSLLDQAEFATFLDADRAVHLDRAVEELAAIFLAKQNDQGAEATPSRSEQQQV